MKKIIIVLGIAIIATTAYAGCRVWSFTDPNGRTVTCMECCDPNGQYCNVTCN